MSRRTVSSLVPNIHLDPATLSRMDVIIGEIGGPLALPGDEDEDESDLDVDESEEQRNTSGDLVNGNVRGDEEIEQGPEQPRTKAETPFT